MLGESRLLSLQLSQHSWHMLQYNRGQNNGKQTLVFSAGCQIRNAMRFKSGSFHNNPAGLYYQLLSKLISCPKLYAKCVLSKMTLTLPFVLESCQIQSGLFGMQRQQSKDCVGHRRFPMIIVGRTRSAFSVNGEGSTLFVLGERASSLFEHQSESTCPLSATERPSTQLISASQLRSCKRIEHGLDGGDTPPAWESVLPQTR